MELWQLKQRQSLPLEAKVRLTEQRIIEWYEYWGGNVYISFSGGIDSTVLLDIVRSVYSHIPAVFFDTGLEFPEIRDFVKTFDNVELIKPAMTFDKVLEKYGYPVVSKEQAHNIYEYRHTKSEKLRNLRWFGRPDKMHSGKISEKHKYLVDAPFEVSDKCCDIMKKIPASKYTRQTGRQAIIGNMVEDSLMRRTSYMRTGCNAFHNVKPISMPMAFWSKTDVWDYIKQRRLDYCSIYDMGYLRTGCIFCMFGVHMEKEILNRFQRLELTHPQLHTYCMERLKLREILEFMNLPWSVKEVTR